MPVKVSCEYRDFEELPINSVPKPIEPHVNPRCRQYRSYKECEVSPFGRCSLAGNILSVDNKDISVLITREEYHP